MRHGWVFDGFVTAFQACGLAGSSVAKGMKKISYKGRVERLMRYRHPGTNPAAISRVYHGQQSRFAHCSQSA